MSSPKTFTTFHGPLTSISSSSSPPLQYLCAYVPAIDTLDRSAPEAKRLKNLVAPTTNFEINNGPRMTVAQLDAAFEMRTGMMELFSHQEEDVKVNILRHGEEEWTVIVEGVSVSVFKKDESKEKVVTQEILILKLESAPEGKGVAGLWATSAKAVFDTSAIQCKVQSLK